MFKKSLRDFTAPSEWICKEDEHKGRLLSNCCDEIFFASLDHRNRSSLSVGMGMTIYLMVTKTIVSSRALGGFDLDSYNL